MPTSKKQMEKLNKVKKAKVEELSKQVAAEAKMPRKNSKSSRKNSSELFGLPTISVLHTLMRLGSPIDK
ncbi:MAG: hypothetical protein WC248_03150 [Candidatus Methanomethylophilaceae archaeon]|jgi:hypothetical protein